MDGVPSSVVGGAAPDPRVAPLADSLARRLRSACQGWEEVEFTRLVERIVQTKLRWEDRGYAE